MSSRPLAVHRPAAYVSLPLPARTRRSGMGAKRQAVLATDEAMQRWHRAFHQLHTESNAYTVVGLRMEPATPDGRCVFESAQCNRAGGGWLLIAWEVDVPGIQFCDCADQQEALALFAEPSKASGRWSGVRLAQPHRSA